MKDMFLKKSDIYYSKWATVVQKFQLSMTKLGNHDEIRWFDGIRGPQRSVRFYWWPSYMFWLFTEIYWILDEVILEQYW